MTDYLKDKVWHGHSSLVHSSNASSNLPAQGSKWQSGVAGATSGIVSRYPDPTHNAPRTMITG